MTDLTEFQFEISGGVAGSYVFGHGCPIFVDVNAGSFDPGTADWRTQTSDQPQGSGRRFGRDFLTPPTWAWALALNLEDTVGALAETARLARVWRDESIADTPGALATLRYCMGGRTRRVYGRPRRFAAPKDNRILGGGGAIAVDFECADAKTYEDIATNVLLSISPAIEEAIVFPIEFPFYTLTDPTPRQGFVTNVDDADTPILAVITGPVTAPSLYRVGGWRLDFPELTLGPTESITINTYPTVLSVLRENGGSVGGKLARRQRLSRAVLPPGESEIVFDGLDETGTARCALSWRGASNSL